MPCLLALLAFFMPRLVLVLFFLTGYLGRAFTTILWPFLGFFFMPFTTLAYAYAMNHTHSLTGYYFFLVLAAALIDLGAVGGGYRTRRLFSRRD